MSEISKVVTGLSVSLDGFVAGPDDGPAHPLGDGGGRHPMGVPFFLLTHNPPDQWVGPGTGGTVVTDGIESALKQAQAVAGGRAIGVCAADVAQQYLRAGLLDEIHISLVPVLLGGGVRLFRDQQADLECTRVAESDAVTHLSYRVLK